MKRLNAKDMVMKMVGPVNATKCPITDPKHEANLQELIDVVDSLVTVLADCMKRNDYPFLSSVAIASKARHYLNDLRDALNDDLEGMEK